MPCHCSCGEEVNKVFEVIGKDPMEILYQRRSANFIYVVPAGLRELMTDISREVIRMHPSNLNMFIADYLHALMITRENAKVAMRFVEDVGDTGELLADLIDNTQLTRHQIDKSARIIQRTFRRLVKTRKYEDTAVVQEVASLKIMDRLKVTIEEANKAASVIQHAYHVYKLRQERRYRAQENPELYTPFRHIDWLIAAQKTFDIFKNIRGVRMTEYNKAATLIQAAYKGYYTRKFLKDYWLFMKKEEVNLNPDDESVKQKKDLAARVLQKFFKRILEEVKKQRNLKSLIDTEIISQRSTTSTDFDENRDKAARIIQRFFRRIIFQERTKFIYVTDEVDSDMYEIDTDMEYLFGEEDEYYY